MSNSAQRGHNLIFVAAIVISAFIAGIFPQNCFANPPKNVKPVYDKALQKLDVTIEHSPYSSFHYINKVEIKKNGKIVVTEKYQTQAAPAFANSYKVAAAPGDNMEIIVYCSVYGSKTEKITVAK